jgi:uncharacterized protein (TIGR02186 family)
MRRAVKAAVFCWIATLGTGLHAEELTVALSTEEIQITSNFSGARLTVFGVIERGDGTMPPKTGYDVVIALHGPAQNVVARRKERFLGIWANRASETALAIPGIYAMRTSVPLTSIADPETLDGLQIGIENLGFVYRDRSAVNDPAAEEFRQAIIRLKTNAELFSESTDVEFVGDSVFRTTIGLPASIPVGQYRAEVHLFSGGTLLAVASETMRVSKSGLEQVMFNFSRNQSAIYGLLSVALALFIGWLGGVLFRRD